MINGGGIPQRNDTLNRVYANVLNKPVLVPRDEVTSLGSAIFAFLAAGAFPSIEAAQEALCPRYRVVEPDPRERAACDRLYGWYRALYFAMGRPQAEAAPVGEILPGLKRLSAEVRRMAAAR